MWGRRSVLAHCARAIVAALLVAATVVLPTAVFIGATASPAGAAGGLRESATTTYLVDPAARAVHVTIDLTATNTTTDARHGDIIERSYFAGVIVPALAEATNFHATSDSGAALSVTSRPASTPIAQELEVHFSSNLFSNHTDVVHLHYDLPNGAPRSAGITRVTAAFSTFEAWAMGDPGAANVAIVIPSSFTTDLVGSTTTRQTTGSTVTYSASAIADPYSWGVAVSARDDSKLVSTSVDADGNRIGIRAFPDDPSWGTFVAGRVKTGVPVLEQLIGQPWPAADRLVVTETVTPYLYGYAGWFTRHDNTIEIGDALDPQVILHEVSHLWFNDLLFSDRWIDEGFAQEYASRAVAKLGGKLVDPTAVDTHAAGAIRLNDWSDVNLQAQISEARETYGYNASWFVIHRLTDEIGVAGMQRVIAAATSAALPYRGTTNPSTGDHSWEGFLDYLDEVGGSKQADKLFATYVAASDDTTLAARATARTDYAQLVAVEKGWNAPLTIRESMSSWDFGDAGREIATAKSVIGMRASIEKAVAPFGMHAPKKLQDDYEYRVGDLGAVQREANADLTAARALDAASASVHGHHGVFAAIGLVGAHDGSNLSKARRSLSDGNGTKARAAALAAEHEVADASGAGKLRSGVALGVIVLGGVGAGGLRRRSRKRRERATDPEPNPEPENDEVVAGQAG